MRTKLIEELTSYTPQAEQDGASARYIADLLKRESRCFWRDCTPDHITASALMVSADGNRVLLNHHKFLNKWLCFGGHCDGEEDVRETALRECVEESGIEQVRLLVPHIVDVDRHPIPNNPAKNEGPHFHCDIRFLVQADSDDFVRSDESSDLRWCTYDEAMALLDDTAMRRLMEKWNHIKLATPPVGGGSDL